MKRLNGSPLWWMMGVVILCLFLAPASLRAAPLPRVPAVSGDAQATDCTDLVVNGSFEEVSAGWGPVAGSFLPTRTTESTIGGRYALLLGPADPAPTPETDAAPSPTTVAIAQILTLPDVASIELIFHYNVRYEGTVSEADQGTVTLYDAQSVEPLMTLLLPRVDGDSWQMNSQDLSQFAGRPIILELAVHNDGPPGELSVLFDVVAIAACKVAGATGQSPLPPTPTGTAPGLARVDSVEDCRCDGELYTCGDFSSWSVAQACYNLCRVTAGFDVHRLDEDGNGIACELELPNIAASASVTGAAEIDTQTGATTTLTATGSVTTAAVSTAATALVTATTVSDPTPATPTEAPTAAAAVQGSVEQPPTSEVTLFSLLFSFQGLLFIGILVIGGLLILLIAILVLQKRSSTQ